MKTKKLEKYVTNRLKKMRILMMQAIRKFDKETIHQFRIQAKKIRAFMHLLEIVDKKFSFKKQNKYVDSFYKKIGAVRDLQIQLDKYAQVEEKSHSPFWVKYCGVIRHDLAEKQDVILSVGTPSERGATVKDLTALKTLEKNILTTVKKLSNAKIKAYYKRRVGDIQKNVERLDFSSDDMHDLRKLIKEYNYNTKINPKKANQYKSVIPCRKKSWDDIQEILGNWYDSDNMIRDLNQRSAILQLTNDESETFYEIKAQLEVEKALLRAEIQKVFDIHIY